METKKLIEEINNRIERVKNNKEYLEGHCIYVAITDGKIEELENIKKFVQKEEMKNCVDCSHFRSFAEMYEDESESEYIGKCLNSDSVYCGEYVGLGLVKVCDEWKE